MENSPVIKVYEALGCIGDERLIVNGLEGKVYSSSRNKAYTIRYQPDINAIMCNDNGSYYVGYLGYPAIAYLMKRGELNFSEKYAHALKGIHWKDLHVKYDRNKNIGIPEYDFLAVTEEVNELLQAKGINLSKFTIFLEELINQITQKNITILGEKQHPPKGY